MIHTVASTPPDVLQLFQSALLATPCKFHDDSETLWRIWIYIENRLWYKLRGQPGKKKKCETLKEEFLKLYAQIKEKELKEEAENAPKRFFYYINLPNRRNDRIFTRIGHKSRRTVSNK